MENYKLRESEEVMKNDLVLEKREAITINLKDELIHFALKLETLNDTVYKNLELITLVMSRQKELEELIMLQDPN